MNGLMASYKYHSFREKLSRLLRYKLVIPIKRSTHPPEFRARGVAVGCFWAFTPLIGIQMPLVFITWMFAPRHSRFDFSILIAFAWTWVSNVFTALPIYYMFYVTGQIIRGRWDNVAGFDAFSNMSRQMFMHQDLWERITSFAELAFENMGISLLLGSIPYAFLFGWLGYVLSLKFILHHKARNQSKPISLNDE